MENKIIGISLDELQRLMQVTFRGEIESLLQMQISSYFEFFWIVGRLQIQNLMQSQLVGRLIFS